jgi:hypothetical protein
MEVLQVQGDAFSEYYLHKILPQEAKLAPRLDGAGAERTWRPITNLLRHAHRELRGSRQARVTRHVLLNPLAELLGWRLGDPEAIQTSLGEEDGSQPLFLNGSEIAAARMLAIPAEASLDLPPEGLHRRFAPAHSLVRVLEQEGLTWGILLNAYELRVVRRSEGFVSSHLAFSLLDLAADVPGARDAWRLLWGLLRGDAWQPAPTLLDEVVRLGREHQQEVGGILGSQVPAAVERLLQGALTHHANQETLAPFLTSPAGRRALLEHLHGGALNYLYRILFVLYAEARGLLPLDMPAYRDGYALSGARGLVRRVMDRATDPRANPEAATGFYEFGLRALFRLLRDGADLGPEGRIPAYGGGLFHPHREPDCEFPELDDLRLGDQTVAHVLEALTHVQTKRGKVTLSYRELDVEQLGSLYEGLLERTVDYVEQPLWRIRLDGDVVLVTEAQLSDLRKRRGEVGAAAPEPEEDDAEDEDGEPPSEEDEDADAEPVSTGKKKPIRRLDSAPIPIGTVVLRLGLGRKQSGSYYTNRAFVEYLVRRAVDPLAEDKRPEEILKLAVCDPAMGSGHFLVGACRRLAEHLLSAYRARYAEEKARAEAAGREPYTHELLVDAAIHAEVARVWGQRTRRDGRLPPPDRVLLPLWRGQESARRGTGARLALAGDGGVRSPADFPQSPACPWRFAPRDHRRRSAPRVLWEEGEEGVDRRRRATEPTALLLHARGVGRAAEPRLPTPARDPAAGSRAARRFRGSATRLVHHAAGVGRFPGCTPVAHRPRVSGGYRPGSRPAARQPLDAGDSRQPQR